MSDFPCFDSEISASGLKFSIHTELVPSRALFKINTSVSSSSGAAFSFNSDSEENFSAGDIRSQHEKIVGKVPLLFAPKSDSNGGNNVDFAAMYMKKEFRSGSCVECKMAENIKKILVFDGE